MSTLMFQLLLSLFAGSVLVIRRHIIVCVDISGKYTMTATSLICIQVLYTPIFDIGTQNISIRVWSHKRVHGGGEVMGTVRLMQ